MTQRDYGIANSAINPGGQLTSDANGVVRLGGITLPAYAADAAGRVIGFLGPTGQFPTKNVGLRAVLFGDSYMGQETGGNATLDSFDSFQVIGSVTVANALAGTPFRIIKGVAAGGRRILDMLPRYREEVSILSPDLLFVSFGHNDLKGLYGGFSDQIAVGPSELQRQLEYMKSLIRNWLLYEIPSNTTVFLLPQTPPGIDPASVVSINNAINLSMRYYKWNQFLQQLCVERGIGRTIYVPLDRVTINPTSTSFLNRAGHYYDTVHPGIVGTFARAKFLAAIFSKLFPVSADSLPWSALDTYTNTKIATTTFPVFSGGVCTVTFDNSKGALDWRKIEVGEWVTLMIPHSSNSTLGGRYLVIGATDAGVTLQVPESLNATATQNGFISNSTQLLPNPLFLTTTGGQQVVSGVSGTIIGNVPNCVDVANLPATHTITLSTEAHTQRDGSAGFGNWLKVAISVTGAASAANQFELRFRAAATSPVNAAYDNDRKINVGGCVRFGAEIRQQDITGGFAGIAIDVQGNVTDPPGSGNSVTYRSSDFYRDSGKVPNNASHPWPAETLTFTLSTPEMVFEAGSDKSERMVTNLDGRIYVNGFGNYTATLYIGRVGIWVVDEPVEAAIINTTAGV